MTRAKIADGRYVSRPEWARACPFVEATVRPKADDPSSAPAMLQIDSGADVTLLPAAILALPGLAEVGTHAIRGVTGQVIECPIVQLCFQLGNKKLRSVRVCVIDREVGLLGRDLLDLVVLELDGPNQRWTMSQWQGRAALTRAEPL